jgi:hypothetical protein
MASVGGGEAASVEATVDGRARRSWMTTDRDSREEGHAKVDFP